MNVKKLNEEIEQELSSKNDLLDKIKQLYPENIEEDLTAQYRDFVIESLEDLLRPEELDKYAGNLKISKRVTHWPNSSYIEYLIFGLYSEDSVISGRISVQANANGNNSTSEDIRSGFTRNPIGKIENRYNFNPNFIFSDVDTIINELVDEMKKARQQSIRGTQGYIDYVRRTGDLS
jgi:hypothetical protein